MRTTLTGVFRDSEKALRVSDQLRELDAVGGNLRLFLPGSDGQPVETLVVQERSPWLRLTLFGLVTGVVFGYVALSMSPSWFYAVVAIVAGGGFGALLGIWLGGQRYPQSLRPHMRTRYAELARSGRSVLLVDVADPVASAEARRLMEEGGAYVSVGHWPVRDSSSLQPV
ncbi:MAG TPA: hypothetical protein VIA18_06740 [Polyangia bacterium]|jgi:hypothetical protein|nr:hypothetical protein [Polyangia bacterium]